jgi:ribosomal protein L16 Arg81 hydroxylase
VAAHAPWAEDPLGYLIGSFDQDDFFARIYEREHLIAPHGEPERYSSLISLEAIDRLIAGVDLREGQLDLANAARPVAKNSYISAGGLIDRGVIARQFQTGSTIILQQLHQYDPTLAQFCRALENLFSCHVQTNIYATPPNAQGFRTHYDNHDVFVLQISGEKAWRLYDMPIAAPYRGEGFEADGKPVGELRHEFTLKAGDCAYVPRGLMHDAIASGDHPSLHITVGLIVRTWADLMLEAVSEVALKDPAFRRALPRGHTGRSFDRTQARAYFRDLAATLSKETAPDAALDLMIDGFIRSRIPDTAGAIAEAARPIAADDLFRIRPFTPWRLAEDGDKLVVIAPGGDVDFKASDAAALERALSGQAFKLADVDGNEEFVRTLHAFGLITRV